MKRRAKWLAALHTRSGGLATIASQGSSIRLKPVADGIKNASDREYEDR